MPKSVANSRTIQRNSDVFYEEDVTQVTISNMTDTACYFTWNNIERQLPPLDATLNVPSAPFYINDHGNEFDVKIDFRFPTPGKATVIVDYSKLIKC